FVQLAIPNVRRPYPYYGGVVYIKTTWLPFHQDTGVVDELNGPGDAQGRTDENDMGAAKNVFGHTFISADVSNINVSDLGGGSLLVKLTGSYLNGAIVRVGGNLLNTSSPGFLSDYNSLLFATTAQALAQGGATLISTQGVETPIDLRSICKSWDDIGE